MAEILKAVKKSSQGKHKRYGKYKEKCLKYFKSGRYVENKLKKWLKNNAGKDWPLKKLKKKRALFLEMLEEKQRARS